jgi:transposase
MGIDLDGQERGAPAYDPQLLVTVWVAGFMLGIRSSRGLERACREQVTFRWLTGNQCPDHNTLHRFYQKNRDKMQILLGCTVETAAQAGLVDLALRYRNEIVQSFTDESSSLEQVRKVSGATDDYLRLVRQVQAYA